MRNRTKHSHTIWYLAVKINVIYEKLYITLLLIRVYTTLYPLHYMNTFLSVVLCDYGNNHAKIVASGLLKEGSQIFTSHIILFI